MHKAKIDKELFEKLAMDDVSDEKTLKLRNFKTNGGRSRTTREISYQGIDL